MTATKERKAAARPETTGGALLFTMPRSALAEALALLLPIVPGRATLPIAQHALVETDGDGVWFSVTDFNHALRLRVPAATSAAGLSATLPVRRLADIVAELPPIPVTLTLEGATRVRLTAGRSTFQITTLSPDEFPSLPIVEGVACEFDAPSLLAALAALAPQCSTEPSRPTLNGIVFDATERAHGALVAFATDGVRAIRWGLAERAPFVGEWIVPASAAGILKRIVGDAATVRFSAVRQNATFTAEGRRFTTRLIEGPYAAYSPLLTRPKEMAATVERDALLATVARALAMAPEHNSRTTLTFGPDTLTTNAADSDHGRAEDVIDCTLTGAASMRIAVNARALTAVVSALPFERVRLCMKSPERILYIEDESGTADPRGIVGLLMPLRLDMPTD